MYWLSSREKFAIQSWYALFFLQTRNFDILTLVLQFSTIRFPLAA